MVYLCLTVSLSHGSLSHGLSVSQCFCLPVPLSHDFSVSQCLFLSRISFLVAKLVSYLGSSDAVTDFIRPWAAAKWDALADCLADPSMSEVEWPDEGNVIAALNLYRLNPCESVRRLMSLTIKALVEKSKLVYALYVEAKELSNPVPATEADIRFHRDPIASSSFYYFNKEAAPRNRLCGYDTEEADCLGDCSKVVSCLTLRENVSITPSFAFS